MSIQRIILSIGIAGFACGCQVTPTPETTPPTITVTIHDKLGVNPDTVWTTSNNLITIDPNMDILIYVVGKDAGGMNTLSGSLQFFANACGAAQGGGYFSTIDSFNETATHNPPNTVTDTLPYLHEVTAAQLKALPCNFGQSGSSGLGTIVVTAVATNQSNIQAQVRNDDIHTTGGVIPQ